MDLENDYPLHYQFLLFSGFSDSTMEIASAIQYNNKNSDTLVDIASYEYNASTMIQSTSMSASATFWLNQTGNYIVRTIITDVTGSFSFYDTGVCQR